jgi:aspartyl-tRNA(Asn)/glutamyl-tRNA(Gln) amidotransferase subunit B
MQKQGSINRTTASSVVFPEMWKTKKTPEQIVSEHNLAQVADSGAVEAFVDAALAANSKTVEDYRGGKKAALGRLMGEAMKASGGKANPRVVRALLLKKLGG